MKTCISSHEIRRMIAKFVVSGIMKYMFQCHWCCAFSTQSTIYFNAKKYELWHKMKNSTPSVLRFLSVIRHESPHYNHVFSKKAQHLWRWISLRMLTRGRLIPRQPRAIKRTTRTELHHEGMYIVKYIHWNTDIKPTALRRYNIYNGGYIHWNISTFWRLFICMLASIIL